MTRKATAILNIIAWGAFWTFGIIAVATPGLGTHLLSLAVCLSGLGFLIGIVTFIALGRPIHPVRRPTPRADV